MSKASEGRVDPERGSGSLGLGGGTTYISMKAKSQSEAEWQIERVERRAIKTKEWSRVSKLPSLGRIKFRWWGG